MQKNVFNNYCEYNQKNIIFVTWIKATGIQ